MSRLQGKNPPGETTLGESLRRLGVTKAAYETARDGDDCGRLRESDKRNNNEYEWIIPKNFLGENPKCITSAINFYDDAVEIEEPRSLEENTMESTSKNIERATV